MIFVTLKDLKELTDCHHKADMFKWLDENGYLYEKGRNGWPKVLNSYLDTRLGGSRSKQAQRPKLVLR